MDGLGRASFSDLNALSAASGLVDLSISGATRLADLSGLAGEAALTALHLRGSTRLFDITGLETLTALERLDVSLVGRSRRPTDPCTLAVRPDNDDMTDRASVQAYQDKVALVYAIQSGDRAEVERHVDRTHLNLYGCKMLANPGLLQLLTNLESLDLRWCEGLPFKVWRKNYDTPEKVAAFFERLAKKLPL